MVEHWSQEKIEKINQVLEKVPRKYCGRWTKLHYTIDELPEICVNFKVEILETWVDYIEPHKLSALINVVIKLDPEHYFSENYLIRWFVGLKDTYEQPPFDKRGTFVWDETQKFLEFFGIDKVAIQNVKFEW